MTESPVLLRDETLDDSDEIAHLKTPSSVDYAGALNPENTLLLPKNDSFVDPPPGDRPLA